jgi:hypothetical protein
MSELFAAPIYAETCPRCSEKNYFSVGDPEDMTGVDVEGLECWSCLHIWLLDGLEDWTDVDDANIEKGQKRPR